MHTLRSIRTYLYFFSTMPVNTFITASSTLHRRDENAKCRLIRAHRNELFAYFFVYSFAIIEIYLRRTHTRIQTESPASSQVQTVPVSVFTAAATTAKRCEILANTFMCAQMHMLYARVAKFMECAIVCPDSFCISSHPIYFVERFSPSMRRRHITRL